MYLSFPAKNGSMFKAVPETNRYRLSLVGKEKFDTRIRSLWDSGELERISGEGIERYADKHYRRKGFKKRPISKRSVNKLTSEKEGEGIKIEGIQSLFRILDLELVEAVDCIRIKIEAKSVPCSNNMPSRGISLEEGFFGREEKLEEIQAKLADPGAAIALSGMAGAGKTELAIQTAYESMQDFSGGICWISTYKESRSSEDEIFNLIAEQITSFARSVLEIRIPDDHKLPVEQLRYCLRSWSQRGNSDDGILIIIDDVQIYDHLRGFLDEINRFPRFRVLVTSRFATTGQLRLERIDVGVLATVDALQFLKYLVPGERVIEEKTAATQVCELVGNLPLGIQCLGVYLQFNDVLVSKLLEQLSQMIEKETLVEHQGFMFGEETRIGITARRGIIAALDLTWNMLNDNDKILGKVIGAGFHTDILLWKLIERTIARFADKDPTLAPLKELREDQIRGSKEKLIAYSLLKAEDDREARYRVHPLVLQYFKYVRRQGY